ncbi:asparagine synthase (glutamine-hydrolyzing) [Psychrobacter immobilis]|uniref:asparagine synthase (glutamine-hydrolyzing) n=1 Tax=Psychrobacter immobilis TaxID=498 RepID=UPI001918ACFD|nr:asparagine synthase (glutamine-hydrolyzing) [Psychrobacter immobilis]
MCGLVGFFQGNVFSSESQTKVIIKQMTDSIVHRGPDSDGLWYQLDDQIALGHRRLAILDLSEAGHQPMLSDDERYVIVFNGEIYNHLDIRVEIESLEPAISWKGHSDTETLLKAIQIFGWDIALQKLIGMFAIALWDDQEKQLLLARDRFGEKPLYYGWQNDSFLFGSELKAITQHSAFEKQIEKGAVPILMKHGYIAAPYSIWRGIYKLPAAHYLKIEKNNPNPKPVCYWSFNNIVEQSQKDKLSITDDKAIEDLEELLTTSIKRQMLADVPLGALLSGGIDSSLVVALMQKVSSQPVKTFSIGFDDPKFDESKHAEAVAKHLGTDHTTLIMTPDDMLELVPEIAKIYDEPFADSSQLPTTIVCRLAKQHVTVALSGDAGDEIFGGYNRYFLATKVWSVYRAFPAPFRKYMLKSVFLLKPDQWDKMFGSLFRKKGIVFFGDKLYKLAQRLEGVNSFDDLYLSLITEKHHLSKVLNKDLDDDLIYLLNDKKSWPSTASKVEKMMALDTLTYLTDDILTKVDRAAMSTSLELRAPFLSHPIAEYAWKLPLNKKIREGKGKWILREILYQYVPQELIDRPKQGFGIPIDDWLRGPLKEWAEDLLLNPEILTHNIFDNTELQLYWQEHVDGRRQLGSSLWSILMFQAWYKENFYGT